MNKNAYVTLVCGDSYIPGALALAKSLRNVNSQAPLVVMYRDSSLNLSDLESEGCLLQLVAPLTLSADFCFRHSREQQHKNNPFTKGTKPLFHNPLDNFLKLRLWELEQFNNVVFLDSDTIVLQNIDILFSYPEGAAAPNVYQTLSDFQRMNSGVFTAKPNKNTFDRMCAALDLPDAYWPRTDQTFLQSFWPQWHGLPYLYNTLQYVFFNLPELWVWSDIKVLHYQYEKPWQEEHPRRELLAPLIDLWWRVYEGRPLPESISPSVKQVHCD